MALLYVPFLQNIFRVTALSLGELALVIGIAFLGFIYLEAHKFFVARKM